MTLIQLNVLAPIQLNGLTLKLTLLLIQLNVLNIRLVAVFAFSEEKAQQ